MTECGCKIVREASIPGITRDIVEKIVFCPIHQHAKELLDIVVFAYAHGHIINEEHEKSAERIIAAASKGQANE
jgi:hypothetical protein